MDVFGWFIMAAFMLGVVGPVLALTWYSMRSEHHSPPVQQRDARDLGDESSEA